jgi:hypothetical protein
MKTFYPYIEALSSHGGFPSTNWLFPNEKGEDEKAMKVLKHNYKNVINKLDERLIKLPDTNIHIYYGLPEDALKDYIEDYYQTNPANRKNFLLDKYKIQNVLQDLFFNKMNTPDKDIVFVKTGPSGDLLTPWMTLHTIGHAIMPEADFANEEPYAIKMLQNFVKNNFKLPQASLEEENRFALFDYPKILSCLLNFRSARILTDKKNHLSFDSISSEPELAYELLASYLWNGGKISRPTKECIKKLYEQRANSNDTINKFEERIDKMYTQIDEHFKTKLDNHKGTVILDLFPNNINAYLKALKSNPPPGYWATHK